MNRFLEPTPYDFGLSLGRPLQVDVHSYPGPVSYNQHPDLHYAIHVGIVLSGRIRIMYEEHSFEALPGEVWFTACWEAHVGEPLERTEIILCTILLDALGAAVPFSAIPWTAPFLQPPHLRPRTAPTLYAEDIRQIGEEFRDREGRRGTRAAAADWLALHRLLLPFATDPADGEEEAGDALERVKPALDLLRGGSREPVRIDEAATACGLGKRRFCDLFRRAFGVSFGQFALRARLAGAGEDVRRGHQSLRAIAKNWGFYDISHLHRAFHRHYGCSPAEFRARATVRQSTPDGQ